MTLSRTWSTTTPANDAFAGDGDDELCNLKVDLKERMTEDHYMDGDLDSLVGGCDGHHRKVTLPYASGDPTIPSDCGMVYVKQVDGTNELFYGLNQSGTTTYHQLTEAGVVRTATLAADLNCNSKNVTSGNFQGTYKSSDSTSGYTGTISFTEYLGIANLGAVCLSGGYDEFGWVCYQWGHTYAHAYRTSTITVKNGLITAYSVGSTQYTGSWQAA